MSFDPNQSPDLPSWLTTEPLRAQLATLYEKMVQCTLDGLFFALLLKLQMPKDLPRDLQIALAGLGLSPFQSTPSLKRVRDVARVGYRLALTPGDRSVAAFETAVLQEIARTVCPPAVTLLDDDRLVLGVAAGIGAAGAGARAAFTECLRRRGAPTTLYRGVLDDLACSLSSGPLSVWSAEQTFREHLTGLSADAWSCGEEVSLGDRIAAFWVLTNVARERCSAAGMQRLSRDPRLSHLHAHFLAAREPIDGLSPLDSALLLHALLVYQDGCELTSEADKSQQSLPWAKENSIAGDGDLVVIQTSNNLNLLLPHMVVSRKSLGPTQGGVRLEPERSTRDSHDVSSTTIGIVTALPKECAAMRLMLERESRWLAFGEGGGRHYYLGDVPAEAGGSHRVALALLPDMGNNNAAITATLLLQHFPSVRNIIMCGIAGGVPRPGEVEHDVRLGDIVVSNRNGVVQYDLVKERPDGTKEYRHPPRPPGAELLDAVRHLLTEEEMGHRPWEEFLRRGDRLRHGERPEDNHDARGVPIEYPADPERSAGQPRVFLGGIAAANALLKNPDHRDYLGRMFGVKAIEMEGSGVADATWRDGAGYLVVRGICDYCDQNKGDVWQGAAAVAAAAYVRALVGSMPLER